jgi:nicotinamidase/pyrazinamidase
MTLSIEPGRDALIIVDVQRDFCPGGALAVPRGDEIVPVINRLLGLGDWFAVATRDWHPPDHCSFAPQGGLWPVHCVADTPGAAFHPALDVSRIRHIVSKATARDREAYSGFQGTGLGALLEREGIRRVFVCGLATDYCVKATALDARRAGLDVVVLEDAVRGVEVKPGDCAAAVAEMRAAGVQVARSADLRAGAGSGEFTGKPVKPPLR